MIPIRRFCTRRAPEATARHYEDVDLAIVAESTYPYLRGGVSAVIHDIAEANPDRSVGIIHIAWDSSCPTEHAYDVPANVQWIYPVFLSMDDHVEDFKLASTSSMSASRRRQLSEEVFAALDALTIGDVEPVWQLYDRLLNPRSRSCPLWPLLSTQEFMASALSRFVHLRMPFTQLFWLLREFFSLISAIAGEDYPKAKTYHSHTTGYAGLLAAIAARQNGGRVLLTEHNLYTRDAINHLLDRNLNTVVRAEDWYTDTDLDPVKRAWMAWYVEIGRLVYRAADHITYLYPAAVAEAEGLGSDRAKSEIVPNGTMLNKFASARVRFEKRRADIQRDGQQPTWRLAYCARLVPIKGLIDLISSVAELVQSNVLNFTLDVMGHAEETPDYAAECYRRTEELGLTDYIRFHGNRNMAEVLGDFDVLILPSYNEGQPLVVMEAMAVGLPIIGTRVGGMEQLVMGELGSGPDAVSGPCGVLVRPGDVTALANAIRGLISDETIYCSFSENSRKRIAQHFTHEKAMGAYQRIYGWLEAAPTVDVFSIPEPKSAHRSRRGLVPADSAASGLMWQAPQ
jgi:polysaccharide biosynthesis protein PelF